MKHENTQETYKKKLRNAVKCYVDSGERLGYPRMGLEPNTVLLS